VRINASEVPHPLPLDEAKAIGGVGDRHMPMQEAILGVGRVVAHLQFRGDLDVAELFAILLHPLQVFCPKGFYRKGKP